MTNTISISTKKQNKDYANQIMHVIYRWAFVVAPALHPLLSTLKCGEHVSSRALHTANKRIILRCIIHNVYSET